MYVVEVYEGDERVYVLAYINEKWQCSRHINQQAHFEDQEEAGLAADWLRKERGNSHLVVKVVEVH